MAKVVFEDVYKSFLARDRAAAKPLPKNAPPPGRKAESGRVSVLRRINLTVEDGEFMVLVGPSGCGKSTLLRLVAGLEELTGGSIRVGDRLVNNLPPKARDIAMVFQSYALYPHLTVYDNLAFGLRRMNRPDHRDLDPSSRLPSWADRWLVSATRSLPKALRHRPEQELEIRERIFSVAQMLQIDGLLRRLPKELSGGQKQRVALGRAIARNPQVFLMDEPLSNLDAKLRAETRAQIVSLQQRLGITTIYVTHDQIEAMTMGQRIAVMADGQIQQVGPPLELYDRPVNRFVAEFIGSPPMNFIPVEIKTPRSVIHEQFRLTLPEEWATTLEDYDGKTLWLGIRPEHLQFGPPATKNLPVRIGQVEAIGSETFVAGKLLDSDEIIQARIEPENRVKPGEVMWLSIRLEKIHLFQPDTRLALRG
ncbi:MAG: ABC transporter ATP-binding protein [Synechococcales cyanobacterium RU_4_20]|nr:ABC transporter ATP-binding protein [Synechococcales cyanobacterium RU_4_20]